MKKFIFFEQLFNLLDEYENEGVEKSQNDYWTTNSFTLDVKTYNVGMDILNMTVLIKYKLSILDTFSKSILEETFEEIEVIFKTIFEDPDGYGIGTLRDISNKTIVLFDELNNTQKQLKFNQLYSNEEKKEISNLLTSLIILYFQSSLEFVLKYCVAIIEHIYIDDICTEFNDKFTLFNMIMDESQNENYKEKEKFENTTSRWLISKYSYKLSPLFLMMDLLLLMGDLFKKSEFKQELLNSDMKERIELSGIKSLPLYEILIKHDPIWEVEKTAEKMIYFYNNTYNEEEKSFDYLVNNEIFYLKKILASTNDILKNYNNGNKILTELLVNWKNIRIEEKVQLHIDMACIYYHNHDYINSIKSFQEAIKLEDNIGISQENDNFMMKSTAKNQFITLIAFSDSFSDKLNLEAYRYLIILKYNLSITSQKIREKLNSLDEKVLYVEYYIVSHSLTYPITGKYLNQINYNYISMVFSGKSNKITSTLCNNFINKNYMSDIEINISLNSVHKINYNRLNENEIELKQIDRMISDYRGKLKNEDEAEQRTKNIVPEIQVTIRDIKDKDKTSFIQSSGKRIKNLFLGDDINNNSTINKLVISRYSEVIRIPFGTLPLNSEEYLIDKFSIIYSDTIPLISYVENRPILSNKQIILCANPVEKCNDNSNNRIYINNYFKLFSSLPFSKEEINAIKKRLNNFSTISYEGINFNKKNIKDIKNVKILHIASHSFSNFREFLFNDVANYICNPTTTTHTFNKSIDTLDTGVILSCFNQKKEINSFLSINKDGVLNLNEIEELDLKNTELVVLSSCDSGLNRNGLVNAFFKAGTSTIIASLWQVSDNFTSKFMVILYEELLKGILTSKALTNTKLKFKELGYNFEDWSSFEVYGEDCIIFKKKEK